MRRKPLIVLLPALAAALSFGVAALARSSLDRVDGPTYSLAQVEAGIELHPKDWVGKTLRLQAFGFAVPLPCRQSSPTPCGTADLLLDDPSRLPVSPTLAAPKQAGRWSSSSQGANNQAPSPPLLLRPEPNRLLDGLRSLPGLGRLLPGPQSLAGGTFRVTIEPAATSFLCPDEPCYQAALADAGPQEQAADTQGHAPYQQGMIGFVYGPTPSRSR